MSQEKSQPEDIGNSSRIRSTSECSYTSDDGAVANITGKRQRTTSQSFMIASGLAAASPPKFVSLEEIMAAANGMRDMNLVHQIVVDDNFRLEKPEPEPTTIEGVIKKTMHKAFWDVLKKELEENPPNYSQALKLLQEVKDMLLNLLLPQHTKLKQQILEILDVDLIKQQAEKGVLDFNYYAQYVISLMAKMCASVRDDKINELKNATDVIEIYKGILETLELMQLDMANFTLQMMKPDIIRNSVEIERKKFADYLAIHPDGLRLTREWLLKHIKQDESLPTGPEYDKVIRACSKTAFTRACIDLLDWDRSKPYPETFILDEDRLYDLQIRTFQIICAATILVVALSNISPDLQTISSFKESLKDHIMILTNSMKDENDLNEILPNIAAQILEDIKEAQKKYTVAELNEKNETDFKSVIVSIGHKEHKVRGIVKQRVYDFYLDIIQSTTAVPQKVPSGLTAFQKELTQIAGQFLRIVSHNSAVFCNNYYDIIVNALPRPC